MQNAQAGPVIKARLEVLTGDGLARHEVADSKEAVVEAFEALPGESWAHLFISIGDPHMSICSSRGMLEVSYSPYRLDIANPAAPDWNLEGKPEATDGIPPIPPGLLEVEVDPMQSVEWTARDGGSVAQPRRWCVTRADALRALLEFLENGEIDHSPPLWCQTM